MQDKIAKLEATIQKQGKRIAKLKKQPSEHSLEDNEYKRLIKRIEVSEIELISENEELKLEVLELKKEVSQLLELLTSSIKG